MGWRISIVEVGAIPELPVSIYFPDAPPGAVMEVPCYCFLLRTQGAALLIDTGADPWLAAQVGFTIVGGGRPAIEAALAQEKMSMDEITYVVHTHLHYDHIENDLLFPAARFFVQRRERTWSASGGGGPFYAGVEEILARLGDRLVEVDGEVELIPGITLVPNGGHTPGHQSVLVDTDDSTVCICGDIVPMRANLDFICSATPDSLATRQFLNRARREGWEMLPGHDPALRRHPWLLAPSGEGPNRPSL